MTIKNLINCDNDNIISKEAKMIANLLLSSTPYQIYNYKQISDEVYKTYNCYIRFNYLDKTASKKQNVASHTIGDYLGEISDICSEIGLPLISVMVFNGQLPGDGFYTAFPLCQRLLAQGLSKKEISIEIRNQVAECFENNLWGKLVNYLNDDNIETPDFRRKDDIEYKTRTKLAKNLSNKLETANQTELYEGNTNERIILAKERNQEIVKIVKEKDHYTCQACNFYYDDKIVETHHLIPISKIGDEHSITEDDLITLCPNCHSLAHYLLNKDDKYQDKNELIAELKNINLSLKK